MTNCWLPIFTLSWRELVRFYRQRNRVIGALGSPLVFWVLIGSGLGTSFRPSTIQNGMSAIEYLYPGTMVLILLFTSIFSTISIIEDRKEGFLQSVLVAPIPRMSLVLGKIFGGTILATVQGLLFLVLAPTIGIWLRPATIPCMIGVLFTISFGLTGLGYCIAWRMDSTHGFHAIMNLFLIPMWLLSGSLFPAAGASTWLSWIMNGNPLTYGVIALRKALYVDRGSLDGGLSLGVSWGIMILFGLFMLAIATSMTQRRTGVDT